MCDIYFQNNMEKITFHLFQKYVCENDRRISTVHFGNHFLLPASYPIGFHSNMDFIDNGGALFCYVMCSYWNCEMFDP